MSGVQVSGFRLAYASRSKRCAPGAERVSVPGARTANAGAPSRSGFTLIEVLLAVVILGVGFAVLLTGVSRCLAVMKTARKYQDAQWVLDLATLEYPMIAGEDPEEMEVDPVEYPDGYTFEREVGEDEDEDGLYVVHSRVTWSERGRHGKEEAVRYVLYMEEE